MTDPEKPPVFQYADRTTRRGFPWWHMVGALIVGAYVIGVILCYRYVDSASAGSSICLCTVGFIQLHICWIGVHFGQQVKDIWT